MKRINFIVITVAVLTVAVLIVLNFVGARQANAQENICADLPEVQCAVLNASISGWKENFGDSVELVEVRAVSPINGKINEALDRAFGRNGNWVPEQTDERGIVSPTLLKIGTNIKEDTFNRWRATLENFSERATHTAEIIWNSRSGKFQTVAILSEAWPYLYDNMLSNVVLERESNSCKHIELLWIWGGVRGEIFVDLVRHQVPPPDQNCVRNHFGRLDWGQAKTEMSEVEYGAQICQAEYAWAWATPLTTISFEKNGFQFSLSGLNSGSSGGGDCVQ